MNSDDALVVLANALNKHRDEMDEGLAEAAAFVDHVGAGRLHAELLDVAAGIRWGIICSGVIKISEGLTLSFIEGVLVDATDYGPQADSAYKSFFSSDEPRREAIELLMNLRGIPESLFGIYHVDYGQHGVAPMIKGVNQLTNDGAISRPVLDAVRWMVDEGLVEPFVQLVIEDAAVDILMDDMTAESPVWSDRLVNENKELL